MRPSEDRHGEGRERPEVQQRCRNPLLVRDDRPARRYPRTGVFATDGSNPENILPTVYVIVRRDMLEKETDCC